MHTPLAWRLAEPKCYHEIVDVWQMLSRDRMAAAAGLLAPLALDHGPGHLHSQLRWYFSAASGANTTTNPAAHTSDQPTRYPAVWPISSSAARPWVSVRTASTM